MNEFSRHANLYRVEAIISKISVSKTSILELYMVKTCISMCNSLLGDPTPQTKCPNRVKNTKILRKTCFT